MIDIEQYHTFLEQKKIVFRSSGIDVSPSDIHPVLFPFQRDITRLALKKGRYATFAAGGLGKTPIQLECARITNQETKLPSLIVAPLSVAKQTKKEAARLLDLEVEFKTSSNGTLAPINITNYEMIKHFNPELFGSILLDESSLLKHDDGKTRQFLTEFFTGINSRFCFTATPSPNDIIELGGHSEFLGVLTEEYMKANFFIHDNDKNTNGQWRLRKHSYDDFYRWLASWSISLRKPSDLGYDDTGYDLPPLNIIPIEVESPDSQAFFFRLKGIGHRSKVRRSTLTDKLDILSQLVNSSTEQWLIFCGLNDESKAVSKILKDCIEVTGTDSIDKKTQSFETFQEGKVQCLVTKPKIAGMGMNFQNANNMVFFGLNDSYELLIQCIWRLYRFGQTKPVNVYVILSELEREIFKNVMSKKEEHEKMTDELIKHIKIHELEELGLTNDRMKFDYKTDEASGKVQGNTWKILLGDSVERMPEIEPETVDFSVYSPPFQDLYVYSPTERDIGNSGQLEDYLNHYGYIIEQLYRMTKPGRVTAVHIMDAPATLIRDGYIGLRDLSGDIIRKYIEKGWIFDSRIPIFKNPQVQSIRTRVKGLGFVQIDRDQAWLRPGLPDYILKFRKPGQNQVPIDRGLTNEEWIDWASPVWPFDGDRSEFWGEANAWFGIRESDTLQGWQNAKGPDDEKHICPLQLGTIERCIKLWSNPGELVFTPFCGIGSETYMAVKLGRNALGIELNPRYFGEAVKNMKKLSIVEERLF